MIIENYMGVILENDQGIKILFIEIDVKAILETNLNIVFVKVLTYFNHYPFIALVNLIIQKEAYYTN